MSQEDLDQLFSELFSFQTSVIINVALLAFVVYEHAITFEKEIEVVWRHRFSVYSILLLVNRYCILAYTILGVISSTIATVRTDRSIAPLRQKLTDEYTSASCIAQAGSTEGLMLALLLDISLLAAIRAFAISTWRYRILIAFTVFAFSAVPLGADLYIWSTETADPGSFGGCGAVSTIDPFVNLQCTDILTRASRISTIVADLIVLAVTWTKTFRVWRLIPLRDKSYSISQAMMRDGTTYFLVFLALNICQIVVFEVTRVGFVAQFLLPVTSVLSSRFIMNLRWIDYENKNSSQVSLPPLSIAVPQKPNDSMDSPDAFLASGAEHQSPTDEPPQLLSAPLAISRLEVEFPQSEDDPFRRIYNMAEIV
ncbi:hypothetical protein BDY19DRAFT_990532 [Irpex rosettiformis]|uniref:Uncharacterized protein n=1 Tax=Irpex rosettiformis TaxID=378272 RepID=A0ACB8UEX3_9APHY|nr:hypothetical protein BDY19DRAFT_990532 [Irpex rosettiformis]